MARAPQSVRRRAAWATASVAIGVLLSAALCETLLWSVAPKLSYARWRAASLSYLLDDATYWKLEPRAYDWGQVNAAAMRGPAVPVKKPEGVYRILVLGGSAAFDMLKRDDATWAELLERELGSYRGKRVEVVNAGTPGFSSYQMLPRLAQLGGYGFDLVLVYELYNDSLMFRMRDRASIERLWRLNARANHVCAAAHPDAAWDAGARLLPRTVDLARMIWVERARAELMRTLSERWHRPELDARVAEGIDFYEQNLERIVRLARSRGADVALVTQASIIRERAGPGQAAVIQYAYRGLSHAELWSAYQRAWRLAVTVAERNAPAFVIPAHLHIPGSSRYFHDEVHLTPAGSALLAQFVAGALRARP